MKEAQSYVSGTAWLLSLPTYGVSSAASDAMDLEDPHFALAGAMHVGKIAADTVNDALVYVGVKDGPSKGEKLVDAAMVPPGKTTEATIEKAEGAGLDVAAAFDPETVDEATAEQMKVALAAVNEAVKEGKIPVGDYVIVIAPAPEPAADPFSGTYNMTVNWPDGFSDKTTAEVTLNGTTMTIAPADDTIGTMTGEFNAQTGTLTAQDSETGTETTVTFIWDASAQTPATAATGNIFSPALGMGYSFDMTRK